MSVIVGVVVGDSVLVGVSVLVPINGEGVSVGLGAAGGAPLTCLGCTRSTPASNTKITRVAEIGTVVFAPKVDAQRIRCI